MHAEDFTRLADELRDLRFEHSLHPKFDGKLAEAEINLRGVAGAIRARQD